MSHPVMRDLELDRPHRLSADKVLTALRTDPHSGLTRDEARARLDRVGPNALPPPPANPAWRRFAAQFSSALVLLLLGATSVSVALWLVQRETGLPYEAFAIFAVVLLNAIIGFAQEWQAEAALVALRAVTPAEATAIRDGEPRRGLAVDLVPGDIMLVEAGDTVPADARLIQAMSLQTTEAALTGESIPVDKDVDAVSDDAGIAEQHDMLFTGTTVTYGRGVAVVTATGARTEIGRIAALLETTTKEITPLQRELDRTGHVLGGVVIGIAIVMIGAIVFITRVHTFAGVVDVLLLGVALAVAAVPEGLPAVTTAVLALGVRRMARRRAIVRHLAAVETLGSASVIASDKTGTLTRNEMTARVAATASGRVTIDGTGYAPVGEIRRDDGHAVEGPLRFELELALTAAERANNAKIVQQNGLWAVVGDPTEGALLVAARKAGLESAALARRLPRIAEVPFSSQRKLMSTLHRDTSLGGQLTMFTKGAPDVLLAHCSQELVGAESRPLTPERRAELLHINESLADRALRTIGVATRRISGDRETGWHNDGQAMERDLVFLGVIGLSDPPRKEAASAVARAKSAGVRPIMITGDHPRTAGVVAREVGITSNAPTVTGAELERLTDTDLDGLVERTAVYARVAPEHKLRIVRALQRRGAIVAMTGDGVNDAPALHAADIGIAMGTAGTDVAREAADLVLADDNYATIVAAIDEGRAIFSNIRKFLRYLLSSNIGEVLTMFLGVVLARQLGLTSPSGAPVLPLLATQILWVNLVTDGAPALALGVDPTDDGLMRVPPRPAGERVVTGDMWRGIVFVGLVIAASTLLVLDASLPGGLIPGSGTVAHGRTMAFTTLVLAQLFNALNARSDVRSALRSLFANSWLWLALVVSLAVHPLVVYVPAFQHAFGTTPLSATDWFRCFTAASMTLWARELWKLAARLRRRTRA